MGAGLPLFAQSSPACAAVVPQRQARNTAKHLCDAVSPRCPAGLPLRQARGSQPLQASTCARQPALLTLQPQPAALPLRVLLRSLSGVRPALALGQQAVLRMCGPWGHAPSDIGAAPGQQGTRFGAQHTCGCVCA